MKGGGINAKKQAYSWVCRAEHEERNKTLQVQEPIIGIVDRLLAGQTK